MKSVTGVFYEIMPTHSSFGQKWIPSASNLNNDQCVFVCTKGTLNLQMDILPHTTMMGNPP
jgi:hypothetical protein